MCPSANNWHKKMWYMCMYTHTHTQTHTHTHTQRHITQILKKIKYCHLQQWRDLENIMLSEVSQTEKDKYYI